MALSNRFGHLVLSTGNKSEIAVGYCTLYGDMAGGYALLSDVPKTLVYELAEELQPAFAGSERIPRSTIEKPPSAELRPNQKDTDSLPPYDVLDPLIEALVERALPAGAGRPGREGPRGARAGHRAAHRRRGIQAAPDAARPEGHRPGLRRGPPLPDRPEVPCRRLRPESDE